MQKLNVYHQILVNLQTKMVSFVSMGAGDTVEFTY